MFGAKWFHTHLYGRKFVILSDHKPLKHLFKEDSATPVMASARIQRCLGGYDYTIEYKPGAEHSNADCMYRLPLPDAPKSVTTLPDTIVVLQSLEVSPVTATEVKKWTAQYPLLSRVMDLVLHGGLAAQAQSASPYGQCESFSRKSSGNSPCRSSCSFGTSTRMSPGCHSYERFGTIIRLVARNGEGDRGSSETL